MDARPQVVVEEEEAMHAVVAVEDHSAHHEVGRPQEVVVAAAPYGWADMVRGWDSHHLGSCRT